MLKITNKHINIAKAPRCCLDLHGCGGGGRGQGHEPHPTADLDMHVYIHHRYAVRAGHTRRVRDRVISAKMYICRICCTV